MVRPPGDGSLAICGHRRRGEKETVPAVALVGADGSELWAREYPGLSVRDFKWMDRTSDGGFVTAGSTGAWADPGSDIAVVRLDSKGAVLWEKRYGGTDSECAGSVIETREGDLLVSGATVSFGAGKLDAYVLRLSPAGEVIWSRTYGAEGWEGQYEQGSRAFQTRDGRFVLVGSTDSDSLTPMGADVAVYLVRIDRDGSKMWERTYGRRGGVNVGTSVEELEDGGYILAGTNENTPRQGIYLVRTDAEGDVVWESTVASLHPHWFVSLERMQRGYLVGNQRFSRSASGSAGFAYLAQVDSSGRKVWELDLGTEGYDRVHALSCGPGGECAVLCSGPEWEPYLVTLAPEGQGHRSQ
jgi:hypothetical protein